MASLTGQVRSDRFKQRISASKGGADFLSSSRRLVTNRQGAFLPVSGAGGQGLADVRPTHQGKIFMKGVLLLPTCDFSSQVVCELEVHEGNRGPVPGSSEGV